MATKIDVNTEVSAIRQAIYGEEVRGSIANAIEKIAGDWDKGGEYSGANYAIHVAEDSKAAAITAKDSASASMVAAQTAKDLAEDARDASQIAQSLAEDAQAAAETAQTISEEARDDAEEYAELARQMGHGAKMFSYEFTLPIDGWQEGDGYFYQSADVTGMKTDSVGIIGLQTNITQVQREIIRRCNISLSDQSTGALSFVADKIPEIDVPLVVNF